MGTTIDCASGTVCNVIASGDQCCDTLTINVLNDAQLEFEATAGNSIQWTSKVDINSYDNTTLNIQCGGTSNCQSSQIIAGSNSVVGTVSILFFVLLSVCI